MYVPSLEHIRLEFDSNFKRKAKYVFLISFMSLSTHGNLHKPLPAWLHCFPKVKTVNRLRAINFRKKSSSELSVQGPLWPQEKSDIDWANTFWVIVWHFPDGSVVKNPPANAGVARGDLGSIPGSGRSPAGGHGNPLLYSYLGNPMDKGTWWATVHGVPRVGHDLATKQKKHT